MTHFEQAIARTRKAQKHLENALEDLKANKHKYHPRTYRILEEPLVEEIQLRQKEINEYLWQLDPQPTGVAVRDPEPDGPPADEASEPLPVSDTLPTKQEIVKLPRWVRVAFAARCARRALPLFKKNWPDAPTRYVEVLTHATNAAENAATFACPADDTSRQHSMQVGHTAYTVFSTIHAAYVAYAVGGAAAYSAHVMSAVEVDPTYAADTEGARNAANAGVPVVAISRDFDILLHNSQIEHWTDDTPVPPSVFGPLWPEGPPPGWPEDENPDRDLVLEIDLPDDATDADVKRYVELLVNKADDVYRAGGGNGLKISGLDITGEKLVAKPSPDSTQPSEELIGGAT